MPFDGTTLRSNGKSEATLALIRAKRRIKQGWCQGALRSGTQVCAIGALSGGSGVISGRGAYAALKWLTAAIDGKGVSAWNDAPGRTKAEVLAAYDRAIELSTFGLSWKPMNPNID